MLEVNEQPQMTEMNQKPIDMETRIENELNGRDCSSVSDLFVVFDHITNHGHLTNKKE